eukprot:868396-Prymnesium_polylepis.1
MPSIGCKPSVELVNEWAGGFAMDIRIPEWIEGNVVRIKFAGTTALKDCYNGVNSYWGDAGTLSRITFVRLGRDTHASVFTCTLDGRFQRDGHEIEYSGRRCFAAPPPPPVNFQKCKDLTFAWSDESFSRALIGTKGDHA